MIYLFPCRNLTLQYVRDEYLGDGTADRDDTTYYYVIGATYKMNRHFYFSAQYGYQQRQSDFIPQQRHPG